MKSAGMIRKRIGKRILTGAFCARSSAYARCRFRSSIARFRMIWPVETPIVSPWEIERENIRTPGVSTRTSRFSSASTSVRPMFCSCSVRRTSDESGSLIFVGGEAKRLREAEAGLERHDEEVDQIRADRARPARGASSRAGRR